MTPEEWLDKEGVGFGQHLDLFVWAMEGYAEARNKELAAENAELIATLKACGCYKTKNGDKP